MTSLSAIAIEEALVGLGLTYDEMREMRLALQDRILLLRKAGHDDWAASARAYFKLGGYEVPGSFEQPKVEE